MIPPEPAPEVPPSAERFDIAKVLNIIEQHAPGYQVPLIDLLKVQGHEPYRILVATILSARTKDEHTALAAARLFAQAPDLDALARLDAARIAELIRPVGFANNKSRYLAELPGVLAQRFAKRIPESMEELLMLPGVGRKTANLVLSVAFGKPAICVDTHVHRISNIWGFVQTENPLATEMALREMLPKEYWRKINRLLVAFGQAVCKAQHPACLDCPVEQYCPKIGVKVSSGRRLKKTAPRLTDGEGSSTLKLVSWNVNGLRAIVKKGFYEAVAGLNPDILALQEIKAHPEQLDSQTRELVGYHAYWLPAKKKGYSGVAVYSRIAPIAVRYGMGTESFEDEGRVLTLEYDDFFIVNAYLPNAQPELARLAYKLSFLQEFNSFTSRLAQEKTVLVCGDLNVAHKEIDLARPKQNHHSPGFSKEERAWMDSFLALGFLDSFREFNQDGGNYTWWSYRSGARERNIGWRIDYFCIDRASRERLKSASIHPYILGSDHCPVEVEITSKASAGKKTEK